VIVFCNEVPTSTRNVSNYANISLHLNRLRIQRQTLITGPPILRSTQQKNLRNDPKGILKLCTVPPMSVHRLRAQNHIRIVGKCILQDVLCVHIRKSQHERQNSMEGIRNGKTRDLEEQNSYRAYRVYKDLTQSSI